MDSWSPHQLQMMSIGGNRRLREFFSSYDLPENSTIQFKYYTNAAEYYRELLKAEVERRQLNYPPPMSSIALQPYAQVPTSRPQSSQSRSTYESRQSYDSRPSFESKTSYENKPSYGSSYSSSSYGSSPDKPQESTGW